MSSLGCTRANRSDARTEEKGNMKIYNFPPHCTTEDVLSENIRYDKALEYLFLNLMPVYFSFLVNARYLSPEQNESELKNYLRFERRFPV